MTPLGKGHSLKFSVPRHLEGWQPPELWGLLCEDRSRGCAAWLVGTVGGLPVGNWGPEGAAGHQASAGLLTTWDSGRPTTSNRCLHPHLSPIERQHRTGNISPSFHIAERETEAPKGQGVAEGQQELPAEPWPGWRSVTRLRQRLQWPGRAQSREGDPACTSWFPLSSQFWFHLREG